MIISPIGRKFQSFVDSGRGIACRYSNKSEWLPVLSNIIIEHIVCVFTPNEIPS